MRTVALLLAAAVAAAAAPLAAQPAMPAPLGAQAALPEPLQEVAFEQRIGGRLPLDAPFLDSMGRKVTLADAFGGRPGILALVYYDCPMLCSLVLNGLTTSLKAVPFEAGEEFQVVVVSFDPSETPAQAEEIRRGLLQRMARPGTEDGWTFLTGDAEAVSRLTEAVGFRYALDETSGEFAHAAGVVVVTPEGTLARYLYGVEYSPRDLRLALVEAADERLGGLVEATLLFCYRYDPETGSYTAITMNLIRLGGLATLVAMAAFLTVSLRRERRLKSA